MTTDDAMIQARQPTPGPDPSDEHNLSFGEAREMLDILRRLLAGRIPRRGMAVYQLLFVEERPVREVACLLDVEADAIEAWGDRIRVHLRQISIQLDLCVAAGWPEAAGGAEAA